MSYTMKVFWTYSGSIATNSFFRSPFAASSITSISCDHIIVISDLSCTLYLFLTKSLFVTTPNSLMTLGWENCPMMAASWRSFTLPTFFSFMTRVFTATSITPFGDFHVPLLTFPNWPDPKSSSILTKRARYLSILLWHCGTDKCYNII